MMSSARLTAGTVRDMQCSAAGYANRVRPRRSAYALTPVRATGRVLLTPGMSTKVRDYEQGGVGKRPGETCHGACCPPNDRGSAERARPAGSRPARAAPVAIALPGRRAVPGGDT